MSEFTHYTSIGLLLILVGVFFVILPSIQRFIDFEKFLGGLYGDTEKMGLLLLLRQFY